MARVPRARTSGRSSALVMTTSGRPGSTSAWSAPAGSARSSVRRWPGPAIAWSRPRRSARQSRERAETCCPACRCSTSLASSAAELVLLTVPDDALAEVVAGLSATGAWQAGQIAVHTSGRYGVGVSTRPPAHVIPLAIHPAMTFSGTASTWRADRLLLRGHRAGPGPAGRRGARRRDRRRAGLDRGGGPGRLPRGPLPRRQPPGHPGRPGHAGADAPPVSTRRTGCSGRCCPPPSTTRCARVTPPSPGRWRAAMPVPWRRTCASSQSHPGRPRGLRRDGPGHRGAGAGPVGSSRTWPNPCWTSSPPTRSDVSARARMPAAPAAVPVTDRASMRLVGAVPMRVARVTRGRAARPPGAGWRDGRRRRRDDHGRPARGARDPDPAGPAAGGARRRHDLPQPSAVRAARGPVALSAHHRLRPGDLPPGGRRPRVRSDARRRLPGRRARRAGPPGRSARSWRVTRGPATSTGS